MQYFSNSVILIAAIFLQIIRMFHKKEEGIMSKKVLMLAGDFTEDYETMVPFQALQAIGYEEHLSIIF